MSNKEILEEAAEKYANNWEEIHPELNFEDITPIEVSKIDFIEGAKWQAERMFDLMNQYTDDVMAGCNLRAEEWVSQFKKQNNEQ
jgi:hypothetical protein